MSSIRYILDSDTITYHQHGNGAIQRRIAALPSEQIATTVVTMFEQLRGRLAAINRKQSSDALERSFSNLQLTQHYYCQIPVLAFDQHAQRTLQHLKQLKLPKIGVRDLQIAAIVLVHDATLVTGNRRHFELVPNLKIEDWMARTL